MMDQHYEHTKYGGIIYHGPNGEVKRIKRDFGLTWQDECSREAHIQMFEYYYNKPCPPDWYLEDPPSVTRPPNEQPTNPPLMPPL